MIRSLGCLFLAAALLAAGCAPNVIVKQWPEPGKRPRVAVLPFKAHPDSPASGELAYEAFSTNILEVKDYDVVDRGALEQVLKEQKLGMTGVIDQAQAVEIGKLLGADGVILGAVTEYGTRHLLMFPPAKISLTARLVNTRSGVVEWTASHRVGGARRWLTLIVWPVWVLATAISPSAEDQIENAARAICRALQNQAPRPG